MSDYDPATVHEIDQEHAAIKEKVTENLALIRAVIASGADPQVFALEFALANTAATHHLITGANGDLRLTQLYHMMNILALHAIELEERVEKLREGAR